MNLFRSEEHIERWLGGRAPGATIPVAKLSELAHAWWDDRVAIAELLGARRAPVLDHVRVRATAQVEVVHQRSNSAACPWPTPTHKVARP